MITTAEPRTRHRVLIIDDELGPRESLRILLKKDYDVSCADSVTRGLELLKEAEPDVVVSDIRMPGTNGIEGLRKIREINADVPVIMLTGYGALETAQEAIRHGASDYMKKPFDANDMLAVIRRNVERADLARRREESRRTLEELNRKLLDEMASKNRLASLGQASAELVHDLRNPMMIILGYVQLLAQELNLPAAPATATTADKPAQEADAYMGVIEQNVRRCKELIESWLDLSRTNRMTLKPVVLNDLITETIEGCRPLAAEKRAILRHELPARAMAVLGHGVQLKRAMQNLIVNAIDALGGEGGQVMVTCVARGGEVEVTIADNGSGIDEQHLPHILKPFYTSKAEGKGSGLGLFITQKIIEDHRGVMAVDSASGRGTRVSFRLPWLDEGQLTP